MHFYNVVFMRILLLLASGWLVMCNAIAPQSACENGKMELHFSQLKQNRFTLQNPFICIEGQADKIISIRGDYSGCASFGVNLLSVDAFALKRQNVSSGKIIFADSTGTPEITVVKNSSSTKIIRLGNIGDNFISETWTIKLSKEDRFFDIRFEGIIESQYLSQFAVFHQWNFSPASIYAFYQNSVVQMRNASVPNVFFPSPEPLQRVYALGKNSYANQVQQSGNRSIDIVFLDDAKVNTVLHCRGGISDMKDEQNSHVTLSGLEIHLGGVFFDGNTSAYNLWGPRLAESNKLESFYSNHRPEMWNYTLRVGANNHDFPVAALPSRKLPQRSSELDISTFLTGIYATSVGTLMTHPNAVANNLSVSQISPTVASPTRGYENNYNFFDPDSFLCTAALLWSHDPFLQDQVRQVIERSGDFLTDRGQLPHHFIGVEPQFVAISGETQTGPNLFWILSALNYAKTTGDFRWLRLYIPKLRLAASYLINQIDINLKLANVPGSLMIDVFLRSNFTTDTNAALVGFLGEFADAENAVGNQTGAQMLRELSLQIKESMNKYLWRDDHYVTQWNYPDERSFRDFIDYDANLIAASFVADEEKARRVLARIDSGKCRRSATWVSEKYYGPKDTTMGNTGDSACGMGRIAWFDALARRRLGDNDGFRNFILEPLQYTLMNSTFLNERLNCDGTLRVERTPQYFEYPSVVAMLLHHVKFGIQIGFDEVLVNPFDVSEFSFNVHKSMVVEFFPRSTSSLRLARGSDEDRQITYKLGSLQKNALYNVTIHANHKKSIMGDGLEVSNRSKERRLLSSTISTQLLQTGNHGSLQFVAPRGPLITIRYVSKLEGFAAYVPN